MQRALGQPMRRRFGAYANRFNAQETYPGAWGTRQHTKDGLRMIKIGNTTKGTIDASR